MNSYFIGLWNVSHCGIQSSHAQFVIRKFLQQLKWPPCSPTYGQDGDPGQGTLFCLGLYLDKTHELELHGGMGQGVVTPLRALLIP